MYELLIIKIVGNSIPENVCTEEKFLWWNMNFLFSISIKIDYVCCFNSFISSIYMLLGLIPVLKICSVQTKNSLNSFWKLQLSIVNRYLIDGSS